MELIYGSHLICSQCTEENYKLVRLYNLEDHGLSICETCLESALELFKER